MLYKKFSYEIIDGKPYKAEEVGIFLGVSSETVRRMMDKNEIQFFKVRSCRRIYGKWIKEYIKIQEENNES
jgi:excisionase family DNA binding protein